MRAIAALPGLFDSAPHEFIIHQFSHFRSPSGGAFTGS
jgi:hypothetical protein